MSNTGLSDGALAEVLLGLESNIPLSEVYAVINAQIKARSEAVVAESAPISVKGGTVRMAAAPDATMRVQAYVVDQALDQAAE